MVRRVRGLRSALGERRETEEPMDEGEGGGWGLAFTETESRKQPARTKWKNGTKESKERHLGARLGVLQRGTLCGKGRSGGREAKG